MKIIYVANSRLPTEKAHGIQIARTCEALVGLGADLELWLPKRRNPAFADQDLFSFYKIKHPFPVRYLPCVDPIGRLDFLPGAGYFIQSRTFALSVWWSLSRVSGDVIVYSRDLYQLLPALKKHLPYFYEIHTLPDKLKKYHLRILRQAHGVISISRNLAEALKQHVSEKKLFVAEDGVDLSLFHGELDKKRMREELGFQLALKIVLYTGHLYEWKGAHVLAQAAEFLSADIQVFLVGGTDKDQENFKKFLAKGKLTRVKLLGQMPQEQIPKYLAAADILVLPNSGRFEISRKHTSPLKLFEYMAAHRPIVSADLPSLREILDETTAVFFVPDDPISMAREIKGLLGDPGLGERLAANAARKVRAYSWEKRAEKINRFLKAQMEKAS